MHKMGVCENDIDKKGKKTLGFKTLLVSKQDISKYEIR